MLAEALSLQQAGHRQDAERLYRAILEDVPRHPVVHHNLGVLAMAENRIEEALRHMKLAVEADPRAVEAWTGYVQALLRAGRHNSARQVIDFARQRGLDGPQFPLLEGRLAAALPVASHDTAGHLGLVHGQAAAPPDAMSVSRIETLLEQQRYADAQPLAVQMVKRHSSHPIGWRLLGTALCGLGQNLPALRPLARAVELDTADALARAQLGLALAAVGRHDEAEASLLKALETDPGNVDAHRNLAFLALRAERFTEAEARLREVLRLRPGAAGPLADLGRFCEETGRLSEANEFFRAALHREPNRPDALNGLAMNLLRSGGFEEAQELFRRLLADQPALLGAHSNLLLAINYSSHHSPQDSLAAARAYGLKVSAAAKRFTRWAGPQSSGYLRVGFVSGDLCRHPVGHFLHGLLVHSDRTRVELVAYPTVAFADDLTARLRSQFALWRPLVGLNDEAAARLIHSDGVDVLIDLSGHTAHNRLPVFAYKPAPVQVSWLGYFATTGMSEIDYLLTDPISVPPEHRDHFTETIWYLPDTRLCLTPPSEAPLVATLPALTNGFITFGSFQNLAKLNDAVLALWARVLAALPQARLRIQNKRLFDPSIRALLLQRLQQVGVAADRVALHGPAPRREYLAAHAEVDLILDSSPFPGGTTTCEALWMGVPTITLAGDRLIARQGASLLAAAGLPEWIAQTPAEYVDKALAFARDLPTLAALRADLRAQVLASPLFDAARFARHFEDALWGMWQRWRSCAQ